MAYTRLDVDNLIKTMSQAGSVVNNWDILCSYDLQSLNRVFLKEYKKNPLNSQVQVQAIKKLLSISYETTCDLKLGNPTLHFSTAETGIYDLQFPLEVGSHCNQTFQQVTKTTTIPQEFYVLVSGPIKIVKTTNTQENVEPVNKVFEFIDNRSANVVVQFGNNMKSVNIMPNNIPEDLIEIFDVIVDRLPHFLKQVDYVILQVISDRAYIEKSGLTPKSFTFTTIADEGNKENAALNIWIQTNESKRQKGNLQPSFYPNSPVLPVPLGHGSSIIFSHNIINNNYIKPALETFYDVTFKDVFVNKNVYLNAMTLVPKSKSKRKFWVNFEGTLDSNKIEYKVDFEKNPFQVYAFNDNFYWTWEYETPLEHVQTKVMKNAGTGNAIGVLVGGVVSFLITGPQEEIDSISRSDSNRDSIIISPTRIIKNIDPFLKLKVSITKILPIAITEKARLSTKLDLTKSDLLVDIVLSNSTGLSIQKIEDSLIDWDEIKQKFLAKLNQSIYMPDIDLGTLRHFAETNILFNDARFIINSHNGMHIPYDTLVIGDVKIPDTHTKRIKSRQTNSEDYLSADSQNMTSSADKIKSPINSAIKWLSDGMKQLNVFNHLPKINNIFGSSEQITNDSINNSACYGAKYMENFNFNTTMVLCDFVIRSITKMEPCKVPQHMPNYAEVKAFALCIVTEFEQILSRAPIQSQLPTASLELDPVLLMSKIEREVLRGHYSKIGNILYDSVLNQSLLLNETPFGDELQTKIEKLLVRQIKQFTREQY